MSFNDAITWLGLPPLLGIYWGSGALLQALWLGRTMGDALRRAEIVTALITAVAALHTPAILAAMLLSIYA